MPQILLYWTTAYGFVQPRDPLERNVPHEFWVTIEVCWGFVQSFLFVKNNSWQLSATHCAGCVSPPPPATPQSGVCSLEWEGPAWQCLREYWKVKLELVLKSDERGFQREDLRERTFLKAGGKRLPVQWQQARDRVKRQHAESSETRPGLKWGREKGFERQLHSEVGVFFPCGWWDTVCHF